MWPATTLTDGVRKPWPEGRQGVEDGEGDGPRDHVHIGVPLLFVLVLHHGGVRLRKHGHIPDMKNKKERVKNKKEERVSSEQRTRCRWGVYLLDTSRYSGSN